MKFPETTERFVAYFDIMGFKDLIYRSDHSAVSDLMSDVSRIVGLVKKEERKALTKDGRGRKAGFEKGIGGCQLNCVTDIHTGTLSPNRMTN